ncbi:MAG: hypothetical protein IT173_09390 [Acidobacteria bacterium]|nr:hypothetical protein [Acidobacteriota bacterium]
MAKFKLLLIIVLLNLSVCGQDRGASFGWDLSYGSLLDRGHAADHEWIRTWLKKSKSPAEAWLGELKGKRPASVILIEYPAFHAAERTTVLLFRTESEASYWEFVEGGKQGRNEEPVKLQHYDAIFNEVSTWKQLPPKRVDEVPDQAFPGYMGFVSYFDSKGAKQLLLTIDDFFICPERECEPGKLKAGRLMAALEPILIPEEEENYKHSSESEIAKMTVEERIRERIKEDKHITNSRDGQYRVIRKYLLLDGPKTFPFLIKLMDGYNPRRLRDSSSFVATQIAVGIDENVVRLRASDEGQKVIDAMKRLDTRMVAEAGAGVELDLKRVTGTNFQDQAIADALWLSYQINMSEAELLDFANYLIKIAPDYPSWSETKYVWDIKRTDASAFSHRQGNVVKKPLRYYQSYLVFKRMAKPKKVRGQ